MCRQVQNNYRARARIALDGLRLRTVGGSQHKRQRPSGLIKHFKFVVEKLLIANMKFSQRCR
jgi:hypothetical protein